MDNEQLFGVTEIIPLKSKVLIGMDEGVSDADVAEMLVREASQIMFLKAKMSDYDVKDFFNAVNQMGVETIFFGLSEKRFTRKKSSTISIRR